MEFVLEVVTIMKRHTAMIIFIIGASSFGFNPLFVKLGFADDWALGEIMVAQVVIALTVLWIIGIFAMKRFPWAVKKLNVKNIISMMLAGCFTGLTSILYYGAMQYLSASLAVVLLFQFVWVGVLYEWILDQRKPDKKTVLSVILTLVGVVFAAGIIGGKVYDVPLIGLILGIGSAFSYSAFIFVSGRVAVDIPSTIRTPIMITGAGILTFAVFPPTILLDGSIWGESLWIYATGVALCGMILTPLLFALSTPHLPSSLATILGSVELPVSVVVAVLWLSEDVTLLRWVGVIIILLAIFVGEMKDILELMRLKRRLRDKNSQ